MLSIEKEIQQSKNRISKIEHQKRVDLKKEKDRQKKKEQHRNYIIGELVAKYFPEVLYLEPGNRIENTVIFEPVESFLSALAADRKLVNHIKSTAMNNNSTITESTDYRIPKYSDV